SRPSSPPPAIFWPPFPLCRASIYLESIGTVFGCARRLVLAPDFYHLLLSYSAHISLSPPGSIYLAPDSHHLLLPYSSCYFPLSRASIYLLSLDPAVFNMWESIGAVGGPARCLAQASEHHHLLVPSSGHLSLISNPPSGSFCSSYCFRGLEIDWQHSRTSTTPRSLPQTITSSYFQSSGHPLLCSKGPSALVVGDPIVLDVWESIPAGFGPARVRVPARECHLLLLPYSTHIFWISKPVVVPTNIVLEDYEWI
ncbi:hypothetical protein BDZ89DRAFT_1076027, partial [Hymenopellis radicata]